MTAGPPEPTVYVVDASDAVRHAASVLVSSAGFRVLACESVERFLDAWNPVHPGCLVFDVRIPGMDAGELRSKLATRQIRMPVILVDAAADAPPASIEAEGRECDVPIESCSAERLVSRIRQLLKQ